MTIGHLHAVTCRCLLAVKLVPSVPEAKAVPAAPSNLTHHLRALFHTELSFSDNVDRIVKVIVSFSQESRLRTKHSHSGENGATCDGSPTKVRVTLSISSSCLFLHGFVQELFNVNICL